MRLPCVVWKKQAAISLLAFLFLRTPAQPSRGEQTRADERTDSREQPTRKRRGLCNNRCTHSSKQMA
jgi:hypothetical protein